MDVDTINALESAYWTPRGENFDFATGDSISALEMLQMIASAGKSRFLLSDGLATVNREGIKPWTGIITPHEMVEELQSGFTVPSDDDFDGVDVTYINGVTWAEETVKCRTPDNPTPVKIENYKLDGVLSQDHAYQIGMRRLMKYLQQRVTFQTTTELDALCYNTGDRIVLTDDIPGNNTISCLVEAMTTAGGVTTFTVTEPLDWSFENPRALIRYQDGSASGLMVARVGDYQLSVPHLSDFDDPLKIDQTSPAIEPVRLVFCGSTRHVYDAIVERLPLNQTGRVRLPPKSTARPSTTTTTPVIPATLHKTEITLNNPLRRVFCYRATMSTYKTGNPLGSAAVKDLFDNAENFALNSLTALIWIDRLGKTRPSFFGMESAFVTQINSQQSQFVAMLESQGQLFNNQIGSQHDQFTAQITGQRGEFNDLLASSGYSWLADYIDGPVTFTNRSQVTVYNGVAYRLAASTPLGFTTTGTTAESWAIDSQNMVAIGDNDIRQQVQYQFGQWLPSAVSIFNMTADYSSIRVRGFYSANDGGEGTWITTGVIDLSRAGTHVITEAKIYNANGIEYQLQVRLVWVSLAQKRTGRKRPLILMNPARY
jgi:hypothetical protein